MVPELTYLVFSVVFLLIHIVVQTAGSDLSKGIGWALGSQDEPRKTESLFAQRVEKAQRNFLETYPIFIALALTLAVTKLGTETTALGAALWFWSRVGFSIVYAAGIPFVRTLVWLASIVGLLLMLWPLLGA